MPRPFPSPLRRAAVIGLTALLGLAQADAALAHKGGGSSGSHSGNSGGKTPAPGTGGTNTIHPIISKPAPPPRQIEVRDHRQPSPAAGYRPVVVRDHREPRLAPPAAAPARVTLRPVMTRPPRVLSRTHVVAREHRDRAQRQTFGF
jgi:hypothetical protein